MAVDTDEWSDVEPPQQANSEPAPQGEANDEEWSDVAGPEQSAPVQASGEDEWTDVSPGAPAGDTPDAEKYSPLGSAAVGAATGILPVGGAAAAAGAVGMAASPLITPVGGFLAGLGTFALMNYLGENAQDKLLSIMGLDQTVKAAMTDNPTSFEVGHMAPGFALGSPVGTLAQRGVGAAVGGAGAAIMDATQGEFNPKNIAIGAGAGFALPGINKAGSKVIEGGASALERLGGNLYRGAGGRYRGGNKNPDLKETPAEEAAPAPQEDEITVSNDVEQTAGGVAMENGPVPTVEGAGNPEGAPMAAREGARPSDPGRNYQKDQAQTQPETTESKVIDTEPMKSDIKAALEPEGAQSEQVPHPAEGADVPPEQGAVPTNHEPLTPEQEQANLAAQQEQHRQASALPASVDPLEASQAQREAAAGLKDRVAAQQKGEAFEGLQDAVPSPKLVPEQAPEALTPAERKSLAEDRAILAKAGWDRALKALDQVHERKQLETTRVAANEIRKGIEAQEAQVRRPDGELRKESRQKTKETGVVAASKAEAAAKNTALDAYKSVYQDFGPASERGKAIDPTDVKRIKESRAYAKEVWDEAVKRLGGDPFKKGSGIYVPNKRTDTINEAVQWIKAVKASATNQNHKSFATLHSTPGLAAEDRTTGLIEGDITHRPQLPEAAEQAETAGDLGGSRITFEHLTPDPRALKTRNRDEYVEDHNELADWLNERSPNEYEKLSKHYDLAAEMDEPADPASLLSDMKQVLADTGRRPKGEITSEVELPAKKLDVPNLPSREEPAASAVRAIPKNSDEFKRLAAEAMAKYGKTPAKSKAEQLEALKAKEATIREADTTTAKLEAERAPFDYKEAVKGGWGDLGDKLQRFAGDESGAGKIPQWLMNRFNPNNPAAPNAKAEIREYADSIGEEFKKHIGREKNILMETNARLAAAPDLDKAKWSEIGKAVVDRTTAALPADLKKVYDEHVEPLRAKADKLYQEIYDLNANARLGMDLPDPAIKGTAKDFMPRRKVGEQVYDKLDLDKFDPLSGRTLSVYSPSLMEREWMALHNAKTGERLTVQRGEEADGSTKMTVWRGGKPQVLKNIPVSLKGAVGDKLSLTIKGNKNDWLFDHATPDEIKSATAGKVQFHDNPMVMFSQQVDDLGKNLNNLKLIQSMKDDPRWQEHTTTSKADAMKEGYDLNPVELEALGRRNGKQVYMPANLRWALNNFFKQGFGGTELDPYRRVSAAAFKTFFALTPFVHPLNELDLAVVSRGSMWLPGTGGYRSLFRNLPRAIQSVNSQDYHQQNISAFGGNPMLASVKVREMYPDAARRFGMDIGKNPSKWDPIAKVWGTTSADLAKTVYNASSDVTWRLSDYLLTLRYMENLDQGHSIEKAVREAHKFVSDYHVPTTVMGKGTVGRAASSALTDPFLVAFGRYKYGVFKSIANMTKDIAKGTPAERKKALGQMAAAVALAWIVYPALDKGLQKISGNDKAEMGRRGLSAIPNAVSESIKKGSPGPFLSRAVTPAPAISMLMEGARNQDWNGRPILPEGVEPFTSPIRSGAYAGDWAARNMIPPYNSISQGLVKEGGGVLPTAGHFLGEQVGAKFPSERAGKFEAQGERRVNQQERQRFRRGEPGVLPDLYDRVTGRK